MGIFIVLIFIILVTAFYGAFVQTVCYWTQEPRRTKKGKLVTPNLPMSEIIQCYIPLWQVTRIQYALYQKNLISRILTILVGIVTLARIIIANFLPINGTVWFASTYAFWGALFLYYLMYSVITANCARMFSMNWVVVVLSFLFPHVMCTFTKSAVPHVINDIRKSEIFEDDANTKIVKRKSNQS